MPVEASNSSTLTRTTNGGSSAVFSNAPDAPRPIGTRCPNTCRRPVSKEAHCSVCHTTMAGPTQFDDHRRDGYCVPLETLGLVEVDGLWTTPEGHASRAAAAERLASLRAGGAR